MPTTGRMTAKQDQLNGPASFSGTPLRRLVCFAILFIAVSLSGIYWYSHGRGDVSNAVDFTNDEKELLSCCQLCPEVVLVYENHEVLHGSNRTRILELVRVGLWPVEITTDSFGGCDCVDDLFIQRFPRKNLIKRLTVGQYFTNRGSAFLPEFTNLESLILMNSCVTDYVFKNIVNCKQLRSLDLTFTRTGRLSYRLKNLIKMESLENISFSGTFFSGKDLHLLAKMPQLKEIALDHTSLTDEFVPQFTQFPSLRKVDLSYTSITSSVLPYLKNMTALVELSLVGVAISEDELKAFRAEMPKTEVISN